MNLNRIHIVFTNYLIVLITLIQLDLNSLKIYLNPLTSYDVHVASRV